MGAQPTAWFLQIMSPSRYHSPKPAVLDAIYFNLRYSVSLRDLGEILAEASVVIGHATFGRCVVKFSPQVAIEVHTRKRTHSVS